MSRFRDRLVSGTARRETVGYLAIEAIEATRLPAITPGPSTRAPAGRRPLTAVVRSIELGEAGLVSLASTPPSSLLRLSAGRQSLGQARYPVRRAEHACAHQSRCFTLVSRFS